MDKIKITKIVNPFDYDSKEIIEVEYEENKPVISYLPAITDDVVYSINGRKITKDECTSLIPRPSDSLVIMPAVHGGGNGILGTLLSIAVMVVAFYAAPAIVGALGMSATSAAAVAAGATGMAAWTTATYIAFGAMMMIGGALVSSMSPTPSFDGLSSNNGTNSTPTYGWSINSAQGQGNPVQVTFGTVKTGGQLISQHVTTNGDSQYLNILYSGGEGKLDSITDIKINDNPISNYDNVTLDLRYGTNTQTVIPNFADSYADQSLNFELVTGEWKTQQTEGNGGKGLEIAISLPNGLYYANDAGGLDSAYVTIQAEYRVVGGVWATFGTWTISEASNSALIRSYRLDNLPAAQYEVRVRCSARSGTSSRYATRAYWVQLTHIIYDDFTYPNISLVGIKALATSQLSGGAPTLTWKQTRSNVLVWDTSLATPAYVLKPANNPAWACYDIIHYCREMQNPNTLAYEKVVFGFPHTRIKYSDFKRWADFCTAKGITFNHMFDSINDFWGTLAIPEIIGRGKVMMKGTTYCCTYDDIAESVCMFSMGNIIKDSFREEYLPIKDRANSVEVTYFDKDQDYNRTTIMCYGSTYDEDGYSNPTQITLYGCDNITQAYKDGMYRIRCNEAQIHTIFFNADIDAIGCQVGDVFDFQHDILLIGFGGRLEEATADTITLDQQVSLEPGHTYHITVTLSTGEIVTKVVEPVLVNTLTDTLTVSEPYVELPSRYDVYSFGEVGSVTKPFRMIGLTRSGELKRQITGLEYVESLYTEATDTPTMTYPTSTFLISGLQVVQSNSTTGLASLNISWLPPRGGYSGAIVSIDGKKVAQLDSSQNFHKHLVTEAKVYNVSVMGLDAFNNPAGILTQDIVVVNNTPNVVSYKVVQNLRALEHSWEMPEGSTDSIEIRKLSSYDSEWSTGQVVVTNLSGTKFIDSSISIGLLYYGIKLIGANGLHSPQTKISVVNVTYIPAANIIVAKDLFDNLNGTFNLCIEDQLGRISSITGTTWGQFEEALGTWGNILPGGYTVWGRTWDVFTAEHNFIWEEKGMWGGSAVRSGNYTSPVYDLNKVMTSLVMIEYNVSGDGIGCSAFAEWRYSSDNITWTDWGLFSPGSVTFRYHQWRINLESLNGYLTYVSSFLVSIDVPDLFQKFIGVAVVDAVNGLRIDFNPVYVETPSITAMLVDGQVGYCSTDSSRDETGAQIKIYGPTGTPMTGIVDVQVWGY